MKAPKFAPEEPTRLEAVSSVTFALSAALLDGLQAAEESGETPNYFELQTYARAIQLLHDDAPHQTDGPQ